MSKQDISKDYMSQWLTLSVADDNTHLLMSYGIQNTSGMVYNLFADKLLQLNLVPNYVRNTCSSRTPLRYLPLLTSS